MRLVVGAVLIVAALGSGTGQAMETNADRWNLADLYPSTAAWNADAEKLQGQFGEIAACKGHLGESAARLLQCLDLRADLGKRLARLSVFAGEQLAEDTGAAASLALQQQASLLGARLTEAAAFIEPEVLQLGAARVSQFIGAEPGLRVHRFPLERILREAPHTLDDAGEALVAKFGRMRNAGASAFSILSDADLPWPKLRLASGEEVTLDATAYTRYREAPERADRKKVMDTFFGALKTYERTMGVMLYSQLKQDSVYASVRKYPDSLSHTLDANNLPVAVLDTLIAQANTHLPTLHRYFRLRARFLRVPDMQYYDIYPPLVHGEQYRFPLAMARKLTIEATAPLGAEYQQALARGLQSGWMDAYPRPRKRSGAHMAGAAYDVHPFVLMNYNDDFDSVSTLAHEWGHAMHSYYANRAQPFVTSRYATFTAEIASTVNEQLLIDRMLGGAGSDGERLFYLGLALEGLRGTFFRQTMFAEFERDVHARVDRGEPLTGERFSQAYCALLKRYHGTAQGVVGIDDGYCIEWAYIPHFYSAFYVYQYATSVAVAALFAQQLASGNGAALERYLGLLKAGGSDYPYQLVKAAGVDLATPAPYEALVARMNRLMDEIEAILAKG